MGKKQRKTPFICAMHFRFTAVVKSIPEKTLFHNKVKETGAAVSFNETGVIAEYTGDVRDNTFQVLLKLFEQQPVHVITLSSK